MLLIYILLAIALISNLHYIRDLIKRRKTLCQLKRLAVEVGARITVHKNPYLSVFRLSSGTEVTLESEVAAYHVRFMTSDGFYKRVVHFASPRYTVSFRKFKFMLLKGYTFVAGSHLVSYSDGFSYGAKVREIPEHIFADIIPGKPNYDTLIFSPTPHTVSYVTVGNTSIRLMRIAEKIFDYHVFTTRLFCERVKEELISAGFIKAEEQKQTKDYSMAERAVSDAFFESLPKEPPKNRKEVNQEPFDPFEIGMVRRRAAPAALLSLGAIFLLLTVFTVIVFLKLERNGTLLFIALVLYIATYIAYRRIDAMVHFKGAFGKTYIATVHNKVAYNGRRSNHGIVTYPYKIHPVTDRSEGDPAPDSYVYARHGVTVFSESGSLKTVPVATNAHIELFEYKDRVLVIGGMPYPFLLSEGKHRVICPACGAIHIRGGSFCPDCGCAFPRECEDGNIVFPALVVSSSDGYEQE